MLAGLLSFIPGVGPVLGIAAKLIPPGAGKWIAVGLALVVGVVYIDRSATNRANAKCSAAAMQGERDKARLERDTALDQARRASEAVAELDRGKTDAESRARDLQLALDKAPKGDACRISPDAERRLRGNAGTSGRQR